MRRQVLALSLLSSVLFTVLLVGCSHSSTSVSDFAHAVPLHGRAYGGNQPITGSTIQLYAAGTGGTGTAATALISATVTTSDGTGLMNSNANAGNQNNTLPAGFFNITGDYTCPSPDSQVYITSTGGNPGLTAGTNNAALAIMASLGSCGQLSSASSITIDEVTTVGSIAALFPYATGYATVGSASTETTALAEEFSVATEYMNSGTGLAPGPNLPGTYYGSSTEINTLADVLAACINSVGGSAPGGVTDGSLCGNFFAAAMPPAGTAPTDTIAAIIDILHNPTNNVNSIFSQQAGDPPFQPTLAGAPSDWTLPIVPLPQTPYALPVAGTYATAQSVTLGTSTSGATIYYTTNGSTPTTSSSTYTSAITVSASETVKAIAVYRNNTSAAGSSAYTITGAPATPVISLAAGTYTTPQVFTVTSATPDAAVYVTTDGSTPSSASTLLAGTLQLDKSVTINAIAIAGGVSSGIASAAYTYSPTSQIINTVAGGGGNGDNIAGTSALLSSPVGVAVDVNGNLYIGDASNNRIRMVAASTGIITTVAGGGASPSTCSGSTNSVGDGCAATSATLSSPDGVAVDASGNLYIAEGGNNRIRKVTAATGIITTVAGTGTGGYVSAQDGGPATSAEIKNPFGVAVDVSGNLYIADSSNNRIRKVTAATGIITTVAGTGTGGYVSAQDGGPAASAELNAPRGVAVDASGNLYIADLANERIRKVTAATGIITTVAGTGTACTTSATTGCLDGGAATSAEFGSPTGVAVDASGNLYIAAANESRIRKVTASTGIISTVVGNGTSCSTSSTTGCEDGSPATSAQISFPEGVAVDASGNLYIGDNGDVRIRKVTASTGIITTVAGTGKSGYATATAENGNAATSAALNLPGGIALDANGNVYIADSANSRVRKLTVSTGVITSVAGTGTACSTSATTGCGDGGAATGAPLDAPQAVAVDGSGNVYIADTNDNRIRMVSASTGIITTVAGNGTACAGAGVCGDGGAATSANLAVPHGIAVDSSGNLYIGDTNDNRVRMVSASTGNITTVAGGGTSPSTCSGSTNSVGDGCAATSASLVFPWNVSLDSSGNLYIGDTGNNRIRKVTGTIIGTVAGGGASPSTCSGSTNSVGDGCAATSASLTTPGGAAVDASGNLYIADRGNRRIRKVTGTTITTVAGNGTAGFTGDGGAATSAELNNPGEVALDANGNLYIADTTNNRIRVVNP